MKKAIITLIVAAVLTWGVRSWNVKADERSNFQTYEYATIRWGGKENTHLIRPNGKVEFLGPVLAKVQRPDRSDDRSLYMNVAMNAVAKEGYEFAGMTTDEIVMRRPISR